MFARMQCYFLEHDWSVPFYEAAPNRFWWEHRYCYRCGAHTRELVASQEG